MKNNNLRDLLKQFVPPILIKVSSDLCKRSVKSGNILTLPVIERRGSRLIVVGNGPSLNMTFSRYRNVLCTSDCLMVNESAMSPLFESIKPLIYMLVDPKYYIDKGYESYRKTLVSLVSALVQKTSWPMTIIMPKRAMGCYALEIFKKNSDITVLFYEDSWQLPNGMTKFEAWDRNLICPPTQTVLNTAVWFSIYCGYDETYLIGADTSFLADLRVDQETNILYTEDTHFYNNKEVYGDNYDNVKKRRPIGTKLHEELFSIGTALKDYWDMKAYADWKGVKVYNASEYSWIDAFERKKLK